MKRLALLLLLCAPLARAQAPTYVQGVAGSSGYTTAHASMVLSLPNPTLSGNTIICAGQFGYVSGTSVSVADDKSDSFTTRGTHADSNQVVWIADKIGATAGARVITVSYSGTAPAYVQAACAEFYNVSAYDTVSAGNNSTGTAITAGSATPSQTGDLVILVTEQDSTGAVTSFTVGSQSNITWKFLQNDWGFGSVVDEMVEWGVYNSTAALNGTATLAPSGGWNAIEALYKAGSAGAAPTQVPYVNMVAHYNMYALAASQTIGIPIPAGDSMAVYDHICPSTYTSALSDSASNTWTIAGQASSSGGYSVLGYVSGASPSFNPSMTLTITESAAAQDCDITVSGFTGTTTYDSTTGFAHATGNQTTSGNLATLSITPSAKNELFFIDTGISSHQITGTASPSYCYGNVVYSSTEASTGEFDENNFRGACYNGLSTSSFTPTLTTSGGAVGQWQAAAIGFKSLGSGAAPKMTLLGVGP